LPENLTASPQAFIVKRSVMNMGTAIHNLPLKIERIDNCKVFKNKLKSFLL
jgi:hypothetical protein